jgi:glycosyltransferase involved in cell wall biosynthesis
MSGPAWHILTGEYAPNPGGVGDYSALLAAALAAAGATVNVWTSSVDGLPEIAPGGAPGVTVHRTGGQWSPADLKRLGAALDGFVPPRRLLVQYAPNVWGYKGLNFGFCRWLLDRRERGDIVRLMFHEVAYHWEFPDTPARWLLAAGQRRMARMLLEASTGVDVSTPAWEPALRACGARVRHELHWQPVPSNIPVVDDAAGVAAVRARIGSKGEVIVGSFGTFPPGVASILADVLPWLLAGRADRMGLLLGYNSERLAAWLIAKDHRLAARLIAAAALSPYEVSRYLQACDLMVQPYPDGVTGRRGSVMAALAHGVATVTNQGRLTEPLWAESSAVGLGLGCAANDLARVAEGLLDDRQTRERLGALGRDLYDRRFAIERTVEALVGQTLGVSS